MSAALALALLVGVGAGPAQATDEPAGTDAKEPKSSATVGIRTGSAQGGDDRGIYEYEVLPRGVVQDWVAVSNYRYKPITVRLFAKDAATMTDAPFAVQQSAETPTGVGAWIALKKNKLTLPPRTEIVVPFQLGVPYNATPGDHAGAIVVSLLAKEPNPEGGSIIVDHRVGMRVHLRVPGDLKPALAIENLKVDWDGEGGLLGRGDATVTYTVRNTGNVRMSASGTVELDRPVGLPSVESEAPVVEDILPGGASTYTTTFENVFGTIRMAAEVRLNPGPIDPALTDAEDLSASRGFWAWPLLLIAEIIGLLLLMGAGGWYERRRRKARQRKDAPMTEAPLPEGKSTPGVLVRSLVVALLALAAGVAPAQAAAGDEWQAKLTLKDGAAADPFDFLTSGSCPEPATNVVGFGYGHGFPKGGAVIVSNTSAGVSNEIGFQMPLVDSMQNLMLLQPDPKPLQGVYKLVLRCIEAEWPDRSLGEYVVAIEFDSPNHWAVQPPLTREPGPTAYAPSTGPNGEPAGGVVEDAAGGGSEDGTGTAEGDGKGGDAAADGQSDALTDAQARAEELLGGEAAGATSDSGGVSGPFLAGGLAVLALTLLLLFGRRLPVPWNRRTH